MSDKENEGGISPRKTSRIFSQSMSCSQALLTVLDEAMGHVDEMGERAAHPLAGGMMHMGHQCGMVWGATLAAGAEAQRRLGNGARAQAAAITAAQRILKSFQGRAGAVDCREITSANFMSVWGQIKYLLTGKAMLCGRLAVKWAPEALQTITDSLNANATSHVVDGPIGCAAVLAKKMQATDEEAVAVSGFAGGIGLSGKACGALGAAIWLRTLGWYKSHPDVGESMGRAIRHTISHKVDFYPAIMETKRRFEAVSREKYLCRDIVGRDFNDLEDHISFINGGGCAEIISALSNTLVNPTR